MSPIAPSDIEAKMDKAARDGSTLIAAHRGGAGLWPENSLTAFQNAVTLPIDLIEFDVHRSADDALVVIHDPTLDRTTSGSGPVAGLPLAELRTLTVKGGTLPAIPLLDEVIAAAKPTSVDLRLELKRRADGERYPGIERQIVERICDSGMLERTIFTSFDWEMLVTVRDLMTPLGLVALVRGPAAATPALLADSCQEVQAMGLSEVSLPMNQMTAEKRDLVQATGLHCGAYAVNNREQIRAAFDLGLTAFTTDRPDWAVEERDARAHSAL
jgi:glycerophosphoryl diester phosphodiesterase